MLSDSSHQSTPASVLYPQLVEQVFRRAERLTHGFLFRKRIKYNGEKKSLTRLWASWKKRYAVLSPGLLRLFPTENQSELDFGKCEEYSLQSASVRSHPYASTGYCIALYLRRNGSNLEITLAFPTELTRDTWFKAFEIEAEILAAEAAQSREKALSAFRDFFKMRLRFMNEEQRMHAEDDQAVQLEDFSSNVADDYSVHYHRALHSLADAVPMPDTPTEATDQSSGEPAFAEIDEAVHTKQNGNNVIVSPSGGTEPDFIVDPVDAQSEGSGNITSPASEQDLQRIVGMSYLAVPLSRLRAESHGRSMSDDESQGQAGSNSTPHSSDLPRLRGASDAYKINIPKMNIVIMAVGTRGDLAPFVLLGRRLAQDGHRVRLATHGCYREDVTKAGLEFYPLAGDPVKLSQFMVKSHGWVLPTTIEILREVPDHLNMLHDIIYSCWPACTQSDPEDPEDKPFVADAIISNPVTYGHIHCAEALGIPLHLMFPQPWVPTKAFPHPLACLSYQAEWSSGNFVSYEVVDRLMWLSVEPCINSFRTQLGLEPVRRGEHGWDMLNSNKVPFACMFSSHLVSRPKDWESHVDIVGNFFPDDVASEDQSQQAKPVPSYAASPELQEWLDKGPAPIFVGFGSMVIDDKEKLLRCIVEASALSGARVLFQAGWTQVTQHELRAIADEVYAQMHAPADGLHASGTDHVPTLNGAPVTRPIYNPLLARATSEGVGDPSWQPDSVMCVGPCPHDWLFQYVAAVVHHGGAGTTAAGLRAGKPTLVCPFFGDQPFWGEMVFRAGVGPRPCPASDLTTPFLADNFCQLLSPETKEAAQTIAEKFKTENGVESAVEAFYRNLPLESMVCDVSIFMGHSVLAEEYCAMCSFKMSKRVSDIVHKDQPDHVRFPCCLVSWGVKGPTEMLEGIVQGVGAATHEIVGGLTDAIMGQFGSRGIADNVRALWQGLVLRPSVGGMYLMKKVYAGYIGQKHVHLPSQVVMRRRPAVENDDILIDEKTIDDIIGAVEQPVVRNHTFFVEDEASQESHAIAAIKEETDSGIEEEKPSSGVAPRSPGAELDDEYDFVHRDGAEPTPRRSESVDKPRQLSTSSSSGNVFQSLTERVRSAVSGTFGLGQGDRSRTTSFSQPIEGDTSADDSDAQIAPADAMPGRLSLRQQESNVSRDSANEYQWLEVVTNLMQSFTEEETRLVMDAFETAKHCLQLLQTLNQNQSRYLTVEQIAALFQTEHEELREQGSQSPPKATTPERSSSAFRLFRQLLANTNTGVTFPFSPRQQPSTPKPSEAIGSEQSSTESDEAAMVAKHVVTALAGSNSVVDFVNFAYFYMSVVHTNSSSS